MIIVFTALSIAAACIGLYSLLSITWKDMDFHERADVVLMSGLLAIISVLAYVASYAETIK